ncbi:MAG TPA: winged helix-turn-helix domain-containing protein [Candidatus Dormibacteraeota bacterium]|nr:winged helix-turn-helix domain-containing protein [Candidatus Dormibacteraeota bacterium]
MNGSSAERVKFGPFEADLHTHEIWKFGVKIKLVGQPFEILAILLRKPGELVTREEFRTLLWPSDTFVDFDHGLNAAVNKLREALSDSAEAPKYVETLPRRGYRFIGSVERPGTTATQESAATPLEVPRIGTGSGHKPAASLSPPLSQVDHARPSRRWRWYLSAAILITIFLFGFAEFSRRSAGGRDVRDLTVPQQRIRTLTNFAEETSEPAFSSDGNSVAFRRQSAQPDGSGIYIKRIENEEVTQLTSKGNDCCPAWSPDGKTIAFTRSADNNDIGIFLVPTSKGKETGVDYNGQNLTVLLGGKERRLDTHGVTPRRGELAWSPDGKTIAFSSRQGIALLSMESGSVRQLTVAPPQSEDWGPAFSADGEKLLFVRSPDSGIPEELMMAQCLTGDVTRISSQHARILGAPQWSIDGKSVIFASDFGSHPGLWRAGVDSTAVAVQINDSGWRPSVARAGYRLAYQRITHSLNIWDLELADPQRASERKEQRILVPSTSETDQGPGPQISPDGKKLAFMSDRSGTMEIWVSERDGSNPVQLTAVGGAGTPRWSPDSQWIAFDASDRNGTKIYKIKLGSGSPEILTRDEFENRCPSWSRDGKWVYFASTRTNEYQVWKIPVDGGAAVQVTRQGGHAALESGDGKLLYYAKTAYANPQIWQVPVDGGAERLVSQQLQPFSWASWAVVDKGIVFAGPSGKGRPWISLYDSAQRTVTKLGEIQTVPFWLGASHDGKSAVFDQPGWQQSQIMLIENFR